MKQTPYALSRLHRENMLNADPERFHMLHDLYHKASIEAARPGRRGGSSTSRSDALAAIPHLERELGGNLVIPHDETGAPACSFCGDELSHLRRR